MSGNIKMFNLRLTGPHDKTKLDVDKIASKYKVIIAAYEDIAWQNMKPEKPHVHVLIETTQCADTVKKFINDLGYNGNEEYKIGKKVDDKVERVIQYACKGKTLGDISNIETTEIDIEKIKNYNKAFWEEKIENDNKYKDKTLSLDAEIIRFIMDKQQISNNHGVMDLRKLITKILDLHAAKNHKTSDHVIKGYINLACNIYDRENEVERYYHDNTKWRDGWTPPKIRPADYEKKASENIEKYINSYKDESDDELERK